MARPPLVFVTDYGRDDTYAAALVGAAWRVDSELRCVSGTHGVPPGDLLAGAYHLKAAALAFGSGTVLCAVVDPGVGGRRRNLAMAAGGLLCVAPDNGLVSYLWEEAAAAERVAVALASPPWATATFAGRDVLAPAAARLAGGAALSSLGPALSDPVLLGEALAQAGGTRISGRVVAVDHFGNCITSVRAGDLGGRRPRRASWAGGEVIGMAHTYEEIEADLGLVLGSAGHLEVAARGGSALARGGPPPGAEVTVELA